MNEHEARLPQNHDDQLATGVYNPKTGEVYLNIPGTPENWTAFGRAMSNEMRSLPAQRLAGLMIQTAASHDQYAFFGPYIPAVGEGGYSAIEEPALSAKIVNDSDVPVRQYSDIIISEARLADIAAGYILPEHLRQPANSIDAAIGYVISKMAGLDEDMSKSFEQLGVESQLGVLRGLNLSGEQLAAFGIRGDVAIADTYFNTLYRAEKLEELEHVLRFLMYKNYLRNKGTDNEVSISLGTDYHAGTGILGEALKVVNGENAFVYVGGEVDEAGLKMGILPARQQLLVTNEAAYIKDSSSDEQRPIWPAELVDQNAAALKQKKELADAAYAEEQRVKAEAAAAAKLAALRVVAETEGEMAVLTEAGYTWKGVVSIASRLADKDELRKYLANTYGDKKVEVLRGVAIYAGKQVILDSESITIYVQE